MTTALLFIVGILFFLEVCYIVIMLGLIWSRVPFIPSCTSAVQSMVKHAHLRAGETVYDLGAGDGKILIAAKRAEAGIRAIGYEIVPPVWFIGLVQVWLSRVDVTLRCGNALKQDLRDADCIFLYLIPAVMPAFQQKFDRELKKGTRVISHAFAFPGREIEREWSVPALRSKAKIYAYIW
ncbi:MAG: hypothetical protein PHH13_00900 [Candidatus Peribacteraceae bacterium]|nr:hypothetical protein [Candidatus Peribacteraceae bacterium]